MFVVCGLLVTEYSLQLVNKPDVEAYTNVTSPNKKALESLLHFLAVADALLGNCKPISIALICGYIYIYILSF